jgi:hypothetical protein
MDSVKVLKGTHEMTRVKCQKIEKVLFRMNEALHVNQSVWLEEFQFARHISRRMHLVPVLVLYTLCRALSSSTIDA